MKNAHVVCQRMRRCLNSQKKGEKEPRVTQIAKQEIETSLDKSRAAFADMLNADGLVLTR